jgi:hypothetical protein
LNPKTYIPRELERSLGTTNMFGVKEKRVYFSTPNGGRGMHCSRETVPVSCFLGEDCGLERKQVLYI